MNYLGFHVVAIELYKKEIKIDELAIQDDVYLIWGEAGQWIGEPRK